MSSGNGRVCCILGVCCPPGSAAQRAKLAEALVASETDAPGGIGERTAAQAHADYIIDNFDLAPRGSLETLKSEVARMARTK